MLSLKLINVPFTFGVTVYLSSGAMMGNTTVKNSSLEIMLYLASLPALCIVDSGLQTFMQWYEPSHIFHLISSGRYCAVFHSPYKSVVSSKVALILCCFALGIFSAFWSFIFYLYFKVLSSSIKIILNEVIPTVLQFCLQYWLNSDLQVTFYIATYILGNWTGLGLGPESCSLIISTVKS